MNYPVELKRQEIDALAIRRGKARIPAGSAAAGPEAASPLDQLPVNTVGLALSGGGIRSATVSLGVLQALAQANRLRQIDYVATASGGGYTAGFLGRLFTRALIRENPDPCGRVQAILTNNQSPQIDWLRRYSNYIFNSNSDLVEGVGVFWRNLTTLGLVYIFLGTVVFGFLRIMGDWFARTGQLPELPSTAVIQLSHWWLLPLEFLAAAVIPCTLAYWLAPDRRSTAPFSPFSITAWIFLVAAFGLGCSLTDAPLVCGVVVIILLGSAAWFEAARFHLPAQTKAADIGTAIRNRLSRALGENLTWLFWFVLWVLLDSLARTVADGRLRMLMVGWGALLAPLLPFLRQMATLLAKPPAANAGSAAPFSWTESAAFRAGLIAFPLAAFLLVLLDSSIHWIFNHNPALGVTLTVIGMVVSIIIGRAFHFLNYSSLQESYAARLCRTFLGASNPARYRSAGEGGGCDVTVVHPNDDLPFEDYHPEESGGPLHLVSVCVNETIDAASQRDVPDSKGLTMCVGPCGVSVGRNFHALWTTAPERPSWKVRFHRIVERSAREPGRRTALEAITRAGTLFHVLKGKTAAPVVVERLSLSSWVAISGAAFGTGTGRTTRLGMALLFGLANLRLGYWWDSRLSWSDRPGRFPSSPWRRLKNLPTLFVPMQNLLLSELRGRFGGPSQRLWNLSDGGFFDNTAMYELLRRRIPFIIAVDAGHDPDFSCQDLAELVRKARTDFRATIEFLDDPAQRLALRGPIRERVPLWITEWIRGEALGKLSEIGEAGKVHAALARVTYVDDEKQVTWILFLKSSLTGDEPVDVTAYQRGNPKFPNDPTTSQFFGESQWESYRMLGEHIGSVVFR